jgi:hypothetical protein
MSSDSTEGYTTPPCTGQCTLQPQAPVRPTAFFSPEPPRLAEKLLASLGKEEKAAVVVPQAKGGRTKKKAMAKGYFEKVKLERNVDEVTLEIDATKCLMEGSLREYRRWSKVYTELCHERERLSNPLT